MDAEEQICTPREILLGQQNIVKLDGQDVQKESAERISCRGLDGRSEIKRPGIS
jgi:hypothetical protein